MMYPDDLAYLTAAITDARDLGRMVATDFYRLPPFVFDYLMTVRMLYTVFAVWVLGLALRSTVRWLRASGYAAWVWAASALFGYALFVPFARTAFIAWLYPVEWVTEQFIKFN